jgi:hypothetical protein
MTNLPTTFASRRFFYCAGFATLLGAALLFPFDNFLAPQASGWLQVQACDATPDTRSSGTQPNALGRAEHLTHLGVTPWHKAGDRGQGLKVAILDSGFSGYRNHLGQALPDHVTVKSCRVDGNLEAKASQHGILCGEVVHALAPEAKILFANWEPDRPDQFLDAVRWARQEGAQIITCSVIMPSWSDCEGGGSVHAELARILGDGTHAGDLLFFASAGNTAERHWSGSFHDNGDGVLEWTNGCTDNMIHPWGTEVVSVEMCCQTSRNLELSVYDVTAQVAVGSKVATTSNDHVSAVVRFQPLDNHTYAARVRRPDRKASKFHLVVLGGGLQVTNAAGSVEFPADGAAVIAVGAVDADGYRCSYSSCGPNSPCPKPELMAPVPFPSGWRTRPFSGTSAASPQAAALAALIWSRHPNWTAKHVREELRGDAEQLSKTQPDCETGYGRIHLPMPPFTPKPAL